jgi:putative endonuclease
MLNAEQQYGRSAEALAAQHLQRKGYTILEYNFRTALGEIDLIARQNGVIVFVEVKSRRTTRRGNPKWAVTPAKQRKISMTALAYLKQHRQMGCRARFDVVTVQKENERTFIEVIANAFELAYV